MKIGIDIDEVITETNAEFTNFYNIRTGSSLAMCDFYTYTLSEVLKCTKEEARRIFDEFYNSAHFDNISPVEGSIGSIKKLLKEHEIYLITARPLSYKQKTERWFKTYLPEIKNSIIYPGKAKTKAEVCKRLGIELIIEDNIKYSLECITAGLKVILPTKPWNRYLIDNDIIRVNSWIEILGHIKQLSTF